LTFEKERVRSLDNIILNLASDFDSVEQLFVLHVAMLLEMRRKVLHTIALHLGTASFTMVTANSRPGSLRSAGLCSVLSTRCVYSSK
jgi:hypothetical protein